MKKLTSLITAVCLLAQSALAGTTAPSTDAVYAPGIGSDRNYAKNPDCAKNVNNITVSGTTISRNTSSALSEAGTDCALDMDTIGDYVEFEFNAFDAYLKNGACEVSFFYTGDASLYTAQVFQGSTGIGTALTLVNAGSSSQPALIKFSCGDLSATSKLRIAATSASAAAIKVAKINAGKLNSGSTAQASVYGAATMTSGCEWAVASPSTSFQNFGSTTGCTATYSGLAASPGSLTPGAKFSSLEKGDYKVTAIGVFNCSGASTTCQFRISDGTNTRPPAKVIVGTSPTDGFAYSVIGYFSYTGTQSNITFQPQAARDSGTGGLVIRSSDYQLIVEKLPTVSELSVKANNPTGPTVQTFTSGSGTYTRPANVSSIEVEMVGGGGGGGGNTGAGGTGGVTTFGTSLLTANGGVGGAAGSGNKYGGVGGTASLASPAQGHASQGGSGGGGNTLTAGQHSVGGSGAASPFGGAGGGASAAGSGTGQSAVANSGSGGGGTSSSTDGGGGGGAGGYVHAVIQSPGLTYAYAVGAAGTAGSAGGGAGGSGFIRITEYYGNQSPQIPGAANLVVVAKTATYTAQCTDDWINVDATSAAFTVTLPPAASCVGKVLRFKKTDGSSNAVTLDGNASETIDGAATKLLAGTYSVANIISNGSNWFRFENTNTLSPTYNSWSTQTNPTSGVDTPHPSGALTFTAGVPGTYRCTVMSRHQHSNSYTLVRGDWTFGGTATVFDMLGTCEWAGIDSSDLNGTDTCPKLLAATAGQTFTMRPTYRRDGPDGHTFSFGYLCERIGD